MLWEFVTQHRDEIIARCRIKVAQRSAQSGSQAEVDHGVPMFLDQLVESLHPEPASRSMITETATRHGRDLFKRGFTVSQVVHDYGDICQAITEMALERDLRIEANDFRVLNCCLDDAIAAAVTEYGLACVEAMAAVRESDRGAELGRSLRASVYTASMAFGVIKSGKVGIAGSTGTVVEKSLSAAQDLIDRLIDNR